MNVPRGQPEAAAIGANSSGFLIRRFSFLMKP
jgi:hypothetical protein